MADDLQFYRALPYKRVLSRVSDESGDYWVCRFPEIPGLFAEGDTRPAAVHNAFEAFDDTISVLLEIGHEVPMPRRVS